ncbi:MAG: sugar ABC transporter permease [Gammaproteobacteria bacterium]|nr:MAG: sugar ABC transporter permease [Gammaproteobacteria bacterium]
MIRLEHRPRPSRVMQWLAPLIALALTLLLGALMFLLLGVPVGKAFHAFFVEPVSSQYGLAELAVKAGPLVMMGVALSLGFRAGVWNIGAEGQFVLGAITGGSLALLLNEVDNAWLMPLMMLAGVLGGMLWAAIPAFLRTTFNANEILTSLMLSYVAALFLSYLVSGPLKDPMGFSFPQSASFHDAAMLAPVLSGTRLTIAWPLALLVVLVGWVLLSRTLLGFALRVNGEAPRAARYAGFSESHIIWFALLFGGGVAGLAGLLEVAGPIGQLQPNVSPGYGFTAIIVAFLGRLHPVGVLFAGLVLALFYLGGESAQITMQLPLAVAGVFQGLLLFMLLATDVLIHFRIVSSRRALEKFRDAAEQQERTVAEHPRAPFTGESGESQS